MASTHIAQSDWLKEGKSLFGENFWKWKFVCPVCGNIQTAEDFKALGVDPQRCYQECIGRHTPNSRDAFGKNGKDAPQSPCNYAAYGLFHLGRLVKSDASGHEVPVFGFATETAPMPVEAIHGAQ